jgi:hypothetical protein
MHRDQGRRSQSIFEPAEGFSLQLIESARGRAAQFLVLQLDRDQPHRRVHNREVEPHFRQTFVHHLGENRSCEVRGISRRNGPPGWEVSSLAPLLDREAPPTRIREGIEISRPEPLYYLRSRRRFQVFHEQRRQLEGVPVRVDDRMIQPRAQLL